MKWKTTMPRGEKGPYFVFGITLSTGARFEYHGQTSDRMLREFTDLMMRLAPKDDGAVLRPGDEDKTDQFTGGEA